jgi:glucans biosynthesis protein C
VVPIALTALLPGAFARAEIALRRVLSAAGILVLPALLFAFYRLVLFPRFPQNNALIGDWYNHALYFTTFALRFVLASSEGLQKDMVRWRWTALIIAIALFVGHLAARVSWPSETAVPLSLGIAGRVGYGLYQWCCIVAVLGLARGAVTRDSKARRYLTEAIFPYYIVHQTVIVGCAFALRDQGQPAWIEATIILAATAASCALTYEIVKRVSWLRPLFGLKPRSASM